MKTLQEQRTETVLNMQKRITELEKENAELKEINEGYCRNRDRLISMGFPNFKDCKEYAAKLTKAKEIIKDYMIVVTSDHTTVCSVPEENHCINVLKLNEQAEQFIKDSEVEK